MAADVTATVVTTEDGETLEAELALGDSPRAAVLITHPHPQMGGDMYTPVPAGFFRAAARHDIAALRFNFRGTGRSTGTHDHGNAERLDVQAGLAHLAEAVPSVPLLVAGWSFGADMALTLDDDAVAGWFLAAPPLSVADPADMAARHSAAPKVLAIGERDQFNPPTKAEATIAGWTNTSVHVLDGADHFFGAALPQLVDDFIAFIDATTAPAS